MKKYIYAGFLFTFSLLSSFEEREGVLTSLLATLRPHLDARQKELDDLLYLNEPTHEYMDALCKCLAQIVEEKCEVFEPHELRKILKELKYLYIDTSANKVTQEEDVVSYRKRKCKKFCKLLVKCLAVSADAAIGGDLAVGGDVAIAGDLAVAGTINGVPFPESFVTDPARVSLDNAAARFDGTSGLIIQNSSVIIPDFSSTIQPVAGITVDDGTTANISLALSAKGEGAIIGDIPDGTALGGNARGDNATDFQTERSAATQVASGMNSGILSGFDNTASGPNSVVVGGGSNVASGNESFVGGGDGNIASGFRSTIPGGDTNVASGSRSFAAGTQAQAANTGSFVWCDSTGLALAQASSATNQWTVRASGGSRFFSNSTSTTGVTLAAGGSAWVAVSDRNVKENFTPVNTQEVLEKVVNMPITQWNLQSQDPSIKHMGPVAQDFAVFGLGEDPLGINTQDADGVLFASVQGLYKVMHMKLDEIKQEYGSQLEESKKRIATLEGIVRKLQNK